MKPIKIPSDDILVNFRPKSNFHIQANHYFARIRGLARTDDNGNLTHVQVGLFVNLVDTMVMPYAAYIYDTFAPVPSNFIVDKISKEFSSNNEINKYMTVPIAEFEVPVEEIRLLHHFTSEDGNPRVMWISWEEYQNLDELES
jgi:hypothetical protein